MSRLRCERCGLIDERAAIAREAASGHGYGCRRCGGMLRSKGAAVDPVRRDQVVAVRSAVAGPRRLQAS